MNSLNKVKKAHDDNDDKMKKAGASVGQLKFANQQLTVQFSQFVSGIATGQPILMTLIQQGHQVADVMWASGISMKEMAQGAVKMLGSAFSLLLTPVGAAITAFVAVAGAITAVGVAAESAYARVGKLQQGMAGVRDNFGEMAAEADEAAKILAKTTSLTTDEARGITAALGKQMDFTGRKDDMIAFAKDIQKLALGLGEDIPAATKRFTDALELPSKGAEALIGRLKGIDGALVDNLKRMEASGDYAGAFTKLMEAERAALDKVQSATTDLQKAHERLAKAFTVAGEGGKSFMEQLGDPVVRTLATIERAIAAVVEKLVEYNNEVAKQGGPTLGEFLMRGVSPMLPGGLPASIASEGIGGQKNRAATMSAANGGSVTLTTRSGVSYTVRKDLAPQFQGLVNDLEDAGVNISKISSTRPGATYEDRIGQSARE